MPIVLNNQKINTQHPKFRFVSISNFIIFAPVDGIPGSPVRGHQLCGPQQI